MIISNSISGQDLILSAGAILLGKSGSPQRDLSGEGLNFAGIYTDSRLKTSGFIFWPLVGETHDGHDFIKQAVESGAAALIVHKVDPVIEKLAKQLPIFLVPDTLLALQSLATHHRRKLKATVVGITGSNGKTSTKEFLAAMLSKVRRTHWSQGSFNNHWGVPISILSAPLDSEVVLLEMGMNHAGEIKQLCEIAEPDMVLCTLVGKTHIEHFQTVDAIAAAKEEIYLHSKPEATRIFNLNNPWTAKMYDSALVKYPQMRRCLGFMEEGSQPLVRRELPSLENRVLLKAIEQTAAGLRVQGKIAEVEGDCLLQVLGAHHVCNAMAAATVALALNVAPREIWRLLPECRTAWGRMQLLKANNGVVVLFDGYNSSPDSFQSLLSSANDVGSSLKAKRLFGVFAEMKELGIAAAQEHEEVGRLAARVGFAKLHFYGPSAEAFQKGFGASAQLSLDPDFNLNSLRNFLEGLGPGDLVFVKGSRGMKTERFVQLLLPEFVKPNY